MLLSYLRSTFVKENGRNKIIEVYDTSDADCIEHFLYLVASHVYKIFEKDEDR